ncbi:MAG TPA: GNVR domain-containing protein, partial [Polyangiaceae bacterium]|nr:GNVR domain-containing protein [Polyangiaceae bacterium]
RPSNSPPSQDSELFELRRLKPVPANHGLSLRDRSEPADIGSTLRDKRWVIALCALLAVAVVLGFTLSSRMTFRTSGSLYLGEVQDKGAPPANAEADFLASPQGELGTEIEILKSEMLATNAILESGLNVNVTPYGWNAPRYWKWRMSQRDPNLVEHGALDELAATGELRGHTRQPRAYRVKFTSAKDYELWTEPHWLTQGKLGDTLSRVSSRFARTETQRVAKGKLGEALTSSEVRLTLAPGSARAPNAGAEYSLTVYSVDDVLQSVSEALSVMAPKSAAPGGPISVVRLEFSHPSPRRAQLFLEKLMRGYLNQRQVWKTEEATAAESFVSQQLQGMRESLDGAEKRLADYKESSGVVMLSDEAKALIEQLANFEQQRVAVGLQASSFRDVDRMLKKSDTAPMEAYLLGETQDTVLAGLGASLTKAQEELKRLEQQFQADAPSVREQRAQVAAQLDMVKNYVATRSSRAKEQLGALGGMINQYERKLKTMPRAEVELAQLGRHTDVLSKTYSYLLERQQQAAIVKAASISENRILDLPKVPYVEDTPRLGMRLLLGGLLGLAMGVVFVLGRKRFASTFQTANDITTRLNALPVFGMLPSLPRRKRIKVTRGKPTPLLDFVASQPSSEFGRACTLLRANIYRSDSRGQCKVMLVTSSTPRDGKTTCALGLATVLAADRNRVLLIDANMQKPVLHALLGSWQEPG